VLVLASGWRPPMRWRVSARPWPGADFCAESHGIFFLLTYLLLDRLKASTPARIISVSPGHAWVTLDFDYLQMQEHYSASRLIAAPNWRPRTISRRSGSAEALSPGRVAGGGIAG